MKTGKLKTPKTVSKEAFDGVLGNLIASGPVKRKDARTREKKKEARIIPPKSQSDSD